MQKKDYMYYLAMAGVAVIIIWAILKAIGVFQSPAYIEMIPVFSAAVALGSIIATVTNVKEDVGELKIEVRDIREKTNHLDKEVEIIKSKINAR